MWDIYKGVPKKIPEDQKKNKITSINLQKKPKVAQTILLHVKYRNKNFSVLETQNQDYESG